MCFTNVSDGGGDRLEKSERLVKFFDSDFHGPDNDLF